MKKIFFIVLVFIIQIKGMSQDLIIIKHIGISNKPFSTIFIEKINSVNDHEIYNTKYPATIIKLNQNEYSVFHKLILSKLFVDTCTNNENGVFEFDIIEKGIKKVLFLPNRKSSLIYFDKLIEAVKENNLKNELITNFELLLQRIKY